MLSSKNLHEFLLHFLFSFDGALPLLYKAKKSSAHEAVYLADWIKEAGSSLFSRLNKKSIKRGSLEEQHAWQPSNQWCTVCIYYVNTLNWRISHIIILIILWINQIRKNRQWRFLILSNICNDLKLHTRWRNICTFYLCIDYSPLSRCYIFIISLFLSLMQYFGN